MGMRMSDWVILSGNANRPLAQKICEKLGKPLGHCGRHVASVTVKFSSKSKKTFEEGMST